MPEPSDRDDLPLFRDVPGGSSTTAIPAWRPTPADRWAVKPPSARALASHYPDLVRRNLEFLDAVKAAAIPDESPQVGRFRDLHGDLIAHVARWQAADPGLTAADAAGRVVDGVNELADLRRQLLEGLEPDRRRRALAAESRARIPDRELERAIAMAGFQQAEERGEVVEVTVPAPVEVAVPAPVEISARSEFILDPAVIASTYLKAIRADQECRPLPAQERLSTLLSQIPATWLDASWQALGLDADRPAHRKERERRIASYLNEVSTLQLVVEGLSAEQRRLLAYLLEKGGRASAAAVTRRFGDDREDGWFWDEEPPTSTLGRLRVHGLVFVGADITAVRRPRTVLVPRELRGGLKDLLKGRDADAPDPLPDDSGLRPDILEAVESAFLDGVVELVGDESWLTEAFAELGEALSQLPGARVLYEHAPGGEGHEAFEDDRGDDAAWQDMPWEHDTRWQDMPWEDGAPWEDMPWEEEAERSYGLFFLSPRGDAFRFETQGEFMDEDGRRHLTTVIGRTGYVVAVSTLAPFALLRVTSMDSQEGVGVTAPDIEPQYFDETDQPCDETFLCEMLSEQSLEVLHALRDGIIQVLETFGIAPLPEEEAEKPVPWLEEGEGMLFGALQDQGLTVEEALFFRQF